MLLVINGESDKAWNVKRLLLNEDKLDLERELRFNAAICFKNKKSSTYYEYRIRIWKKLMGKMDKKELLERYSQELQLITKILGRFFRNYFVWMYRNLLFKLFLPICQQ